MSKVHFVLSYSSSLLCLIVHSADSAFTIDQNGYLPCPADSSSMCPEFSY